MSKIIRIFRIMQNGLLGHGQNFMSFTTIGCVFPVKTLFKMNNIEKG